MKIKICGLFRDADIEYVNEALPDYMGFVFAESKRRVSPASAAKLRRRLSENIVPVGVFVNAPIVEIAALYRDGIISIAQLHGTENADYIIRLKEVSAAKGKNPVQVIKTIQAADTTVSAEAANNADYYLIDSGAGSGKAFDWSRLPGAKAGGVAGVPPAVGAISHADCVGVCEANSRELIGFPPHFLRKPWFLAGGITLGNIIEAMSYNSYGLDISGGAETDGVKDRRKILALTSQVRKAGNV